MTRFSKSLLFLGIGLVLFGGARLTLILFYPDDFSELSAAEVAWAFTNGIRFDLQVLLAILGGPLLLMNWPSRRLGKRWFDGWAWAAFAPLPLLALVLGGDLAYFGYVHRHVGDELLLLGSDLDFLSSEALGDYRYAFFGVVALSLVIAGSWKWLLSRDLHWSRRPVLVEVILLVIVATGTRGTVDSKPLGLIDAYRGSVAIANLSLNGVFSAFHASSRGGARAFRFFERRAAYEELGLADTLYPAQRRGEHAKPTGLNLVILLLESWDPRYLDSYSGGGHGITPNLDSLVPKGVKFENCYAVSQRSVDGIQAILTGVPPLIGQPRLGWGLQLSNLTEIGSVARGHGYKTLFVQSSKRRSYRLDSAAKSLGFEHVYGREDIPLLLDYPQSVPKWGWDYETLQFALERINEFDAPFLAFIFTGSTHPPFPDAGERFRMTQGNSHEDGFVNALHYSDWALGRFLEGARASPWFERTVFVLAADHIFRRSPRETSLPAEFRIPFVIYGPGRIEPRVIRATCSQLDGLPTFFGLLGFGESYSALGRDLLRDEDGVALVRKGELMGIIREEGWLAHSLEKRVETGTTIANPPPAYWNKLERRLLASVQVTNSLLRRNRWAPPNQKAGGGSP